MFISDYSTFCLFFRLEKPDEFFVPFKKITFKKCKMYDYEWRFKNIVLKSKTAKDLFKSPFNLHLIKI